MDNSDVVIKQTDSSEEIAKQVALRVVSQLSPDLAQRVASVVVSSVLQVLAGCGDRPVTEADKLAQQVCQAGKHLNSLGLMAGTAGNISVRDSDYSFLITPGGKRKNQLHPGLMVRMSLDGKVLSGTECPSSEYRIHQLAYLRRPDVNAVLHTHPPYAVSFAAARVQLNERALAEAWLTLGPKIPLVPFGSPSAAALADNLEPHLRDHNAFLLVNHGALTLGETLDEAICRTETLEFLAKILATTRLLGGEHQLSSQEISEVAKAHGLA